MFEELLRLSPDAVVIADSAGRVVELNRAAEEMFGFSRVDLLGQLVEILIPHRFRGKHPAHRDHYVARSDTRPMGGGLQLYGLRKDGTEFPVDIMLAPADGPTGKVVVSVIRDVSEQWRVQIALRRSEQLFRSTIEVVRDYAIFTLDREGNIASWNSGAEHIKGYKADEVIGQHFSRFYTEEDICRSKPDEELRIAAETGRVEDEGWRLRKDGSRFWANVVITAIREPNGDLTGFLKITRDFTDRKRAEEALLLQLSEVLLSNVESGSYCRRYLRVSRESCLTTLAFSDCTIRLQTNCVGSSLRRVILQRQSRRWCPSKTRLRGGRLLRVSRWCSTILQVGILHLRATAISSLSA
jgi:formate hydrogenlyase transcriptional activator